MKPGQMQTGQIMGMQAGQMGMQQGQMGMQPGQIGMQPGQIGMQPGQIGMQPGQIGMQPGGNNPAPNSQPTASKNISIPFLVKDIPIGVQGNSNMSIANLVKNFKTKLCDENINIDRYIISPLNVELDPNSTDSLASKGIAENVKIIAVTK